MSYNYTQYIATIANLMPTPVTDPNYQAIIPNMIDDAEQRVYRELDILNTVVRDSSGSLTANSRTFNLTSAQGRFVVTNNFNVFTPVNTTTNRNQLVPVTRDWMDAIWPNEAAPSTPSVPQYYAMITDQQIIVGPAPDATYTMEIVGTIRPTPLSASNLTSPLSLYFPDVFIAASMIFIAGWMKNFGQGVDDPQAGVNWESHYKNLIQSAATEEARKRYMSNAWTSMQPMPLATPPRA